MTTPVNPWFVGRMLGPLAGLADDDEAVDHYRDFDADDEPQVRELIRTELAPYFRSWDDKSREKAKLALAWALSFHPERLKGAFEGALPPFESPDDYTLFFERLWEELFGDEDYHLSDPRAYHVHDVSWEVNLIRRIPRPAECAAEKRSEPARPTDGTPLPSADRSPDGGDDDTE